MSKHSDSSVPGRFFSGKVAAITGAGSGIGRALALHLARENCDLALSDINAAGLEESARLARDLGVQVTTAVVDVANREAVEAWADQTAKDHGKVNMIFNNAGVALGSSVEGTSYENFEWLLNINLWGVIYGTKAFLPHLKKSGDGHVINVSSLFGLVGIPGQSVYNTAKFAVRGFTESLRQEMDIERCNVSVLCVHPGGIKTNINASARMDSSIKSLVGSDSEETRQSFEKLLKTTPDDAADTILKAVRRKSRRVLVGSDAKALDLLQRFFPAFYQRLIVAVLRMRAAKSRRKALASN